MAPGSSIVDFLRGLHLASTQQDAGNRLLVEGLALGRKPDGAVELTARKLEAASWRIAFDESAPGLAVGGAWSLGPLAAADGAVRAKIIDAHLMFDADVTVPIRPGADRLRRCVRRAR